MGNAGPRGAKISRSVRVHGDKWEKAKRRATDEGTTINGVIEAIVEGYADGFINLPKVSTSYATVVNNK